MFNTPELHFWFYFLVLNIILFLPRLILDWKDTSLFPIKGLIKGSLFERVRFISYRYNYDFFRICFDLVVICILLYIFEDFLVFSFGLHLTIFLAYFILFIYLIYYNCFDKIYNLPPIFFSDQFLLGHGLKIALSGFLIPTIFAFIGILLLGFGIYFAVGEMLFYLLSAQWSVLTFLILSAFIFMGLFSFTRYDYSQLPQQLVQSPFYSLITNIKLSIQAKKNLSQFNIEKLKTHNIYDSLELTIKPNIFFIVLESYGRILYDDPIFKDRYTAKIKSHEQQLKANDWQMSTALSKAPIVGGSSWLSYSSIMYGFKIDNQGVYLTLQSNPKIQEYHSLFRLLHLKGYKNYQLNSLGGFEDLKIPWETYSRFYNVDEWIKYADLNYNGQHYGFGPSPPDQFALNFAEDLIRKKTEQPFSLFFITQNSHTPFEGPKEVVDDWRTLNDATNDTEQASKFFETPTKADYLQSIEYQLDNVFDFIQKKGGENDLFFIIGDHQPPVITNREALAETPIHLVAKSKLQPFINDLKEYGFNDGLQANLDKKSLAHEGLYSLFMRNMAQHFSPIEEEYWPPYYPQGLPLNKLTKAHEKD